MAGFRRLQVVSGRFQVVLRKYEQIRSYHSLLRKRSRSETLIFWSSFILAGKLYLILFLRVITGSKEENATYFLRSTITQDLQKSTIIINKVHSKNLLVTRCFI